MKFMLGWCIGAIIVLPIIMVTHAMAWEGYVWCATMEVLYLGILSLGINTIKVVNRDQAIYEESLNNNS